MKPYPRWFKNVLLMVLLSLFVSGLLLVPTLLMLQAEMAVPWHLASGQRVWVAALHAGSAMLSLTVMGALWTVHMRAGWRKRRQRVSGVVLCAGTAILALSSLVMYYSGEASSAVLAAWVHVGVGMVLSLPFVWHAWWARSVRRSSVAPSGAARAKVGEASQLRRA